MDLILAPTRFEKSWGLAEFLARFLDLNLADRSTRHDLVLTPEQAGQSLPERLASGAVQPDRVVRPMRLRSDVDVGDGTARIVIPGRRSPALAAAVAGIVAAPFLARPLLQFFRRTGTPEVVQFPFVGFLALALGILPLLWVVHAVLSAGSRTVVTASRTGILIERESVWRRQTRSITAGDLVGLDCNTVDSMIDSARYEIERRMSAGGRPVAQFSDTRSRMVGALKKWVRSRGLVVKSRQGLFVLGEGLPGEELQYLLSVVSRALVGS
jgi:hypothetical protein